jgi:hypothetical protein
MGLGRSTYYYRVRQKSLKVKQEEADLRIGLNRLYWRVRGTDIVG